MNAADLLLLLFSGNPAGYRIYRRSSLSGADELVDQVDEDTLSYDLTGLSADSEQWYYVNAVTACGVESAGFNITSRLRRVAMDGTNTLIPPAPSAPYALTLTPTSGGVVTASWQFRNNSGDADGAGFNLYIATGATPISYTTPDFAVGATTFSQALGTFAEGTTVKCVVRARTSGGVEETNTTQATTTASVDAPDAPTTLTVGP